MLKTLLFRYDTRKLVELAELVEGKAKTLFGTRFSLSECEGIQVKMS